MMAEAQHSVEQTPGSQTEQINELRNTIQSLRTELAAYKQSGAQISRYANQLRTATDVSKQLSSILNLEQLLPEVVTLLRERFQLYHVHVYLLDEQENVLRMVAGSGSVGERLRRRKHAIPLDTERSLVARSARDGYIILVDDVSSEPDFLPNPLLPDTRCEMAIPLIIGRRVLGVLDVQDDRSHRFDQLDIATFSSFSGHIASAIQNAYLFEEQRQAEQKQRRYAERLQSLHDIDQAILLAQSPETIARTAVQRLRSIVPYHLASFSMFDFKGDDMHIFSVLEGEENASVTGKYGRAANENLLQAIRQGPIYGPITDLPIGRSFLATLLNSHTDEVLIYPLFTHEELIGTLNFARRQPEQFSEDEILLVGEVATPLAIAIEQVKLNEQIKQTVHALEEQNAELEQFAYVASHDLQEPLRIIISYVQLFSRRYKGELDEDADIFIHYIVDGATRMKNLINGLLDYSRLGRQAKPFAPTNCEAVLDRVLANLQMTIEEKGATVHRDPLPTIIADEMQMGQLFQNLLSNAIKFSKNHPQIYVGAKKQENDWLFWVKDNGIGLDVQYADRIFAIFQRLHTIEEYSGTGIGLAICKKIVDRHNGRLWVESKPGAGATFFFTIPN